MTATLTLSCLRCGGQYEQVKRRASHFCAPCRKVNNQEARDAGRAAQRAEMRDAVNEYTKGNLEAIEFIEASYATLHEYADGLNLDEGQLVPVVPDRMPVGSNSPAGPDEGTSTYFEDLGVELDQASARVALHPWFEANPHWSYRLHDENVDLSKLRDG